MHLPISREEPPKPDQDAYAQEQLYLLHAPALLAYLRLRVSSSEEAEDLLLEVFLVAIQSKDLFLRVEASQRAWLLAVARHKVIDWYRRKGRQQMVSLERLGTLLYENDAFSPEQVVLQGEAYGQMLALLKQLPFPQQQTVWLKFAYGLNCAEIATVLRRRESTVRTWLSRALTSLQMLRRAQEREDQ